MIKLAAAIDLSTQYGYGHTKDTATLGTAVSKLALIAFSIAAVAVVLYFVVGAFLIITSAGDKGAVTKARNMITHSIIGFILLIMLFLILMFIPAWLGLTDFNLISGGP